MHRRLIAPGAFMASLLLAIPASAADFAPGAPGIGDPYYPAYGNGGYDVSHYDLRLKYQPETDKLEGTATLLARTTEDLSRFNLDFLLDVSEVRVNGAKAAFAASGEHELEITPRNPLPKGTEITVVVRYTGVPSSKEAYGFTSWLRTPDGAVAAGEPEAAWWWFPSNDHPLDKATYDVSVLVPDGSQAISNGTLQSTSSRAGWTRYTWRSNKPQVTYLATLAVGKFDVTTGRTENGIPIINAYSKDIGDHYGAARASVERTGEVADWLTEFFGPYPYNSLGGYVPNTPRSGTRWRRRPGPSTARGSSPTGRTSPSSSMSWPTSGTATSSPSPGGRTSGSTRVSRGTRSGCGPSTRTRGRRRRSRTTCTRRVRPTIPSGRSSRVTPGRRTSSISPCTTGGAGASGVAQRDRGRVVLRDLEGVAGEVRPRERDGGRLCLVCRGSVRGVVGRALRYVAVPAGEAGCCCG